MQVMRFRNLTFGEARCRQYTIAGAICSLSTNSQAIHDVIGESYGQVDELVSTPDLTMQFWVDGAPRNVEAWPKPYFRGLNHLVFARFDSESEVLIDLGQRRIIGRLSPEIAANRAYFTRVVFPAIFGIVSETVRIAPLHCACVARNGSAVLLAGDSGSGKSTLSLALAQSGLAFLSDDWTYLSRQGTRVLAWSISNFLKLLPDTLEHFPELARIDPTISLNGELAYELEAEHVFGIQRCACAEPRCLIFLERGGTQKPSLVEMSSVEAAARLEQNLEDLPAAICEARDFLVKTIRILVQVPCWKLRFGGDAPQTVARSVLEFLNGKMNA
ncbi:MAG TPA: hypothetical protein VGX94_19755 [Terriglobia bacterium]|nr:hypothetical protein [Terriglobia bacterium]